MLVLALAALASGAWYFSEKLRVDGLSVNRNRPLNLEVVDVGIDRITLRPVDRAPNRSLVQNGLLGLEWRDGYARVGNILEARSGAVTRELTLVRGQPQRGNLVRIDGLRVLRIRG